MVLFGQFGQTPDQFCIKEVTIYVSCQNSVEMTSLVTESKWTENDRGLGIFFFSFWKD